MRPHTMNPRNTGGFSLDDAARAYRSSLEKERMAGCPHCKTPLVRVGDAERAERVVILRCPDCGRGVVLQRPRG